MKDSFGYIFLNICEVIILLIYTNNILIGIIEIFYLNISWIISLLKKASSIGSSWIL